MDTPTTNYIALYIFWYVLSCMVVAVMASGRGWNGFAAFIVSVISTPVVGAIMYAPYRQKAEEEKVGEKEIVPSIVD